MARRLLAHILAVLALLSSVYGALLNSAWYCEGRQCGISLWRCCCADPAPYQDAKCRQPAGQTQAKGQSFCPAQCNCVQIIRSAPDINRATPVHAVTPAPVFVAVLPAPPVPYIPPVLIEFASHRTETRGPPIGRSAVARPSLRAPPAA